MAETMLSVALAELGPPIRDRRGQFRWAWWCPLCRSTWPSFRVFNDGERFVCDACRRRGELLDYLRFRHPNALPEQLSAIAGEPLAPVPPHHYLPRSGRRLRPNTAGV
jgi:hypothetical protein